MSWDWDKLREQQQRQKQGPGQGPGPGPGPGGIPPQMDDLIKQFKGFQLPGGIFLLVVLAVVFFGSSIFYTVGIDEVGVVQRFGRYTRTSQPGLNFKLPAGVESVIMVKVRRVYKEEFGFKSVRSGASRYVSDGDAGSVSLMLTGDLNVALAPWIVQYRIKDPYNYLFKIKDVQRILRDLSEASMRLVVGDRSINEVITKREEIAIEAREILQRELDYAEAGIDVVTIEMKKTNVPEPVQPSFNEVNQSIQEKEKMIYKANEEYNTEIPAARGEAERIVKAAEGYALDRINRAEGDAARFEAQYREYVKAQDVTKRRLYLEMIKDVFPRLGDKYIVDSGQKNLLPLLNLGNRDGVIK